MSGKIYSDRCPVHQSILKTDRTKKFCMKKSGQIYDAPIFFCDKCRSYYVFIKELDSGFKGGATANDGYPIKVIGRKVVAKTAKDVKKTIDVPKNTNSLAKQKAEATKKGLKKQGQIVRSIDDGLLTVNVMPPATKLPKACPKCGKATYNLIYKVRDENGKEKQLVGKECISCGSIYYKQLIIQQHPKCFRQAGSPQNQKKLEPKEKVESAIDEKAKSETAKISTQKTADNSEQKKKEVFSTFCPEHNIVLRTPVIWKPGIPLFSCPQCEKYYVSSDKYQYGSIVERFRERPVINVDLIVTSESEPERKENNNAEEQINAENKAPSEDTSYEKNVPPSVDLSVDSDSKTSTDEKPEDQKADKAEEQEHAQRYNDILEPQKEIRMPDLSQQQVLETGAGRKLYTDDFGTEFDFSELESVLML